MDNVYKYGLGVLQQERKMKSSGKVTIANNPKKGAFSNII